MKNLFAHIRSWSKSIRWGERLQQMWLPIIFALGMGITVVFQAYSLYNKDYGQIDEEIEIDEGISAEAQDFILDPAHFQAMLLFFGMGFLVFGLLQPTRYGLSGGKRTKKDSLTAIDLHIILLFLLAADAWWRASVEEWGSSIEAGHWAIYTLLIAGIVTGSTIKQKTDYHLMRFTAETILLCGLITICLVFVTIALILLEEGIETLFDIQHSYRTGEYLMTFIMTGVLGSAMALMLPRYDQDGSATTFVQKTANIIGKYILLPLVGLYMLVLYGYIAKIIFTWQLPDGNVVTMTSIMMGSILAIVHMLYPVMYEKDENKRLIRITRRMLPLLALPILGLMTIGLYRRVSDYGWSVNRVYSVAVNIWFYAACILLLVPACRKKILTILVASFCIGFALLSIIPYYNVSQATQRVLTRQLDTLISEATIAFPDSAITSDEVFEWIDQLDSIEGQAIEGRLQYLSNTFGKESIQKWVSDGPMPQYGSRYYQYTLFDFRLSNRGNYYELPEGYNKIRPFIPNESKVEDLGKGRYQLTFVINHRADSLHAILDTTAIDTTAGYLRLYTKEGDILLTNSLDIYETRRDQKLNLYMDRSLQIKK